MWPPPDIRATDAEISGYTKAVQADPKSARAFFRRGWAYRKRREWEKAIADLTKAIELDPKFLAAYYERADAYSQKGEKAKAKADVETAKQMLAQPK